MFNFSVLIRQLLILIGAGLMIWGVSMPLLGMKIFRDESFFDLSPTGAIILISLAAISVFLALFRKWWGLYLTGLLALILLFYTVGEIENRKASMDTDFKQHVAGGPLRNTMRGLVSATKVRYGFSVMAGGATLLLLVPLLWGRVVFKKRDSEEAKKPVT
ncbi:MAG: hypothetical protein IPH75_08205 [bacterium]|nr:hypothetical protein [bacterium]